MYLPTELVLQVLQNLPNRDLKAVRLASKELSVCAAEFLFRKLYISRQKEDLDAFREFTNHPVIRKCVRTLEYSAVGFPIEITEAEYYRRLWDQVVNVFDLVHHMPEISDYEINDPDPQIDEFARHCLNARFPRSVDTRERYRAQHQEEFIRLAFIKKGHRQWIERATFERLYMQDQDFLDVLVPGLQRLDHLDCVNLRGDWHHSWCLQGIPAYSDTRSGSLAERKWDPFMVAPLSWYYYTSSDPNHPNPGPFWTIVSAVSMTSKKPRIFECESAMSPAMFEVTAGGSRPDHGMFAHGCKAFAGLQRFSLFMLTSVDNHWLGTRDRLTGLQEMLSHMPRLETLVLNLPWTLGDINSPGPALQYGLVFPKSRTWECLTTLFISSLVIHVHELIELLFLKVPNLRRLRLDHINLLEGTWHAMTELFKYGLRCLVDLQIDGTLYHCEQSNLLVAWRFEHLLVELKDYILNGRNNLKLRHPCLRPEDPPETSLAYLPELLRECERKGPQGSLATGVVQSQIDLSKMAYQRWNLMIPEASIDEQA